jgi:hypothetical protein
LPFLIGALSGSSATCWSLSAPPAGSPATTSAARHSTCGHCHREVLVTSMCKAMPPPLRATAARSCPARKLPAMLLCCTRARVSLAGVLAEPLDHHFSNTSAAMLQSVCRSIFFLGTRMHNRMVALLEAAQGLGGRLDGPGLAGG